MFTPDKMLFSQGLAMRVKIGSPDNAILWIPHISRLGAIGIKRTQNAPFAIMILLIIVKAMFHKGLFAPKPLCSNLTYTSVSKITVIFWNMDLLSIDHRIGSLVEISLLNKSCLPCAPFNTGAIGVLLVEVLPSWSSRTTNRLDKVIG